MVSGRMVLSRLLCLCTLRHRNSRVFRHDNKITDLNIENATGAYTGSNKGFFTKSLSVAKGGGGGGMRV